MQKPEQIEGGCLCGATRYRASGKPLKSSYCHCSFCRGVTAAPVAAWLMFEAGQIGFIKGEPQMYASSPGVLRGFCPVCGTPLWWQGAWHDRPIQMVTICSLDDPALYPPDRHASCHDQISWFDVADNLPRYQHSSPEK
jgi:hypothetical protein